MALSSIQSPADLAGLSFDELDALSDEIRRFIIDTVTTTGGHLGSNLGVVELTIALHRVFRSPHDILLFDTGHQSYVHKLLTGRRDQFAQLRKRGGLSGYPNRTESEHDWIESSHASTALSYAHGLAVALTQRQELIGRGGTRHVVAVVGDGSLTGGMAYEALNNLGVSKTPVTIILNDNGRSYAPTISRLSLSLTSIRVNSKYLTLRQRIRTWLPKLPLGNMAYRSLDASANVVREMVEPRTFFEDLGVRYIGPLDGHNIKAIESVLTRVRDWDGPIIVHLLTEKGKGFAPATNDNLKMHDYKLRARDVGETPQTFTKVFSEALLDEASRDERIVALTAAMAGPTGLLPFEAAFPNRFFDVGIAEQHAVTAAAGMAMGGLRPVVVLYSTFFSRAFDQANLDVGLLNLPVTFIFDRAGITGDDGPSHHGVLDLVLALAIPNMTIFAPSTTAEIPGMLHTALAQAGPTALRFPKTPPRAIDGQIGEGLAARCVTRGDGSLCVLAVGKMAASAYAALALLESATGITLYDVRVLPPDPVMIEDAARHQRVITIEDGVRHGGAGTLMVSAVRSRAQEIDVTFPVTRILGVPRAYLEHHTADALLEEIGLDPAGIAAALTRLLNDEPEFPPPVPDSPRPTYF